MIYVDPREGSKELLPLLNRRSGVMAKYQQMEFGDLWWEVCGPDPTTPLRLGVERKRLKDMLNSMRTKRFAGHQLPGVLKHYDIPVLLVEGMWKTDETSGLLVEPRMDRATGKRSWGPVEIGNSRFMGAELEKHLMTLQWVHHLTVHYTPNITQTVVWCDMAYKWGRKDWVAHRSGQAVYLPPSPTVQIIEPTPVRKVATLLPGVGWEKSLKVDSHFPTVVDMALASGEQWQQIEGVGPVLADKITRWFLGIGPGNSNPNFNPAAGVQLAGPTPRKRKPKETKES